MVKKQVSDEQIDLLMRTLVNQAAADEAMLSEIAESPVTWWGVQRKINEQRSVAVSPWPPVGKVLRWLMVGVPVTAAVVLILSFFVFRPATNDNVAVVSPTSSVTADSSEPNMIRDEPIIARKEDVKNSVFSATKNIKDLTKRPAGQLNVRTKVAEKRTAANATEVAAKTTKKEEIKTEFIALSYARDPESGQIVRVKVPSSMMVSLGLVTSVKAPSELVDAEVLVGDDGLTRAIRFIR